MSKYKEVLQMAVSRLLAGGVEEAELDAWFLLTYLTHWNRGEFYLNQELTMPKMQQIEYEKLLMKRLQHIPLQYILGEQEFMGLTFDVNPSVLIPRQDTEILVEEVLKICDQKSILDVCTGSGCIAISLAKLGNNTTVAAVDISNDALEVAKQNIAKHEVDVTLIHSDMFKAVTKKYDIIVSNPPYIPTSVISTLMPEVREHEPMLALDGTEDGLKFYRILAEYASKYLNNNGMVFFEIGCEQAKEVCQLLSENGYYNIKVIKDYAGLDRVVCADYKQPGIEGNDGGKHV